MSDPKISKGGDKLLLSDLPLDLLLVYLPLEQFRQLIEISRIFKESSEDFWKKKSGSYDESLRAQGNALIVTVNAIIDRVKKIREVGRHGENDLSYYKKAILYEYIRTNCLHGFGLHWPGGFSALIEDVFPGSTITIEDFKITYPNGAKSPICFHEIKNINLTLNQHQVVILSLGMCEDDNEEITLPEHITPLVDELKHESSRLRSLSFYETRMSSKDLLNLISALSSSKLTFLGLHHIDTISTEVMRKLSNVLIESTCPLRTLNLRDSIWSTHDNGVAKLEILANALANKTCKLTSLNLSWNKFGNQGVTHLASALKTNVSLTHLNLEIGKELNDREDQEYDFTDAGAKQIASALSVNNTLKKLELYGEHITSDGRNALVEAAASRVSPIRISGVKGFDAPVEQERQPGAAEIADTAGSEASAASNTPSVAVGDLCLPQTTEPPIRWCDVGLMMNSYNPICPFFEKAHQGTEAAAADAAPPPVALL